MTGGVLRVGVGTQVHYDGEVVTVVELVITKAGNEVVLKNTAGTLTARISLRELLTSDRVVIIPDAVDANGDELADPATVVLAELSESELRQVHERAAHVREVLTGYRAGSAVLAGAGEPRPQYRPGLPANSRYAAKAAELGVGLRTVLRWVADFRNNGEAGLASKRDRTARRLLGRVDQRWVDLALEVMVEHSEESTPSRTMVINRTNARVIARFGEGVVKAPSRTTAFRVLEELERRHPTFRLSAKRNRDIADRPGGVYGKLRPTRPGEYVVMDSTRLDVFALDPVTLRWINCELTVAMDWYTRCVTGIRLTPVSTKAVDVASVLFQVFRPRPAGSEWPEHAVWPEHGIPRTVLLDVDAAESPEVRRPGLSGPAMAPETIVVDHGKVFVSAHLTSVCARMGISIQPARLRTGRDKGPVERFFRTLREDLLQALPGYKGPDVHARGINPEREAFFFLDELEEIVREWVAVVYHHRPHDGLLDPHLPAMRMSPAMMFGHGLARAGYIEAPRDPDLALEFLRTEWRTIQHYGVEIDGRRHNGPALNPYRGRKSPHTGVARGRWPFQVDPDDVSRVYFRDPHTRAWHTLMWEHALALDMPFSQDALAFARKLAASRYTYPDDKVAVADLLERWNAGLGRSLAERRIALRLARDQAALDLPSTEPAVATLPSVARVLAAAPVDVNDHEPEMGDVDDVEELAAGNGDFYADALGDV
ncbi:transposase [Amycolatopsis sp. WAC 01375]|uniref:Mu transposase C-terminal domain-containing protein n=1 Tax=Amycolatopsis sp. WAC 01375 TaxID=2203194 RepID=UPI000F7B28C2|nr:Mu transposase C-terminal domain-containing protein [Amycolatopsis sp. WAC 01375]RSM72899.1 transposase [Amycolatopsis sp. WAC 01375]